MLKKFAAGLLATALIAGPAFAQSSSTPASGAPAAQTAPNAPAASTTAAKPAVKSTKSVKPSAKHVRKHAARSKKIGAMHQARHVKSGAHRHHTAKSGVTKAGQHA